MKLRGFYQESKIPKDNETNLKEIEYFTGRVVFFYEEVSNKKAIIQRVSGIKETEVSLVIREVKEDFSNTKPIKWKPNDRVYLWDEEYRVIAVDRVIEPFHLRTVERNPAMRDRYSICTLVLK